MAEVSQNKGFNGFKWALVVALVAAAVVGNLYFSADSIAVRVAIMIVLAVAALLVAVTTFQGAAAWKFIKEARMEMRKVVWPTQQETVQTTLIVIVIVIIMALLLWGIDSLFALIVSNIVM